MQKFRVILLATLIVSLTGCQHIDQFITNLFGESAEEDQTPPPGYDPHFISEIKPIKQQLDDPTVEISRIDISDPSKVRIFLHLINGDQTYLTGAAGSEFADIWCEVYDTTANGSITDNRIKVVEVTEDKVEPLSIAMVMDLSGSMGHPRAIKMQEGVQKFIENKDPDDEISLIRYDSRVELQQPLTANKNTLLATHQTSSGIKGFGQSTATIDAIYEGINSVKDKPDDRVKTVIVFTDGRDNSSTKTPDYIVEYANKNNVIVNTVDYGNNVIKGMLQSVAKGTSGIYHQIYSQEEFEPLFRDIYTRLNNYYVLEYEPAEYGSHLIGLKLCLKDTTIFAGASFDNTPKAGDIALLDVHFDTNMSVLKSNQRDRVRKLLLLMRSNPDIKIELQGHTDNRGDEEPNQKLSQARADAVRQYLIDNKIEADRITSVGFGETRPIATNDTEEGRALNRRTQFKVIK